MDEMFDNCDVLKKIILGVKLIFGIKININLLFIVDIFLYIGRWIGVNMSNIYSDSNIFMFNYDGLVLDMYVWEKVSVLNSILEFFLVRVYLESEVEWIWKIINLLFKLVENVYLDIILFEGFKIDKNSVKKNNLFVLVDDINGMNNLGILFSNEIVIFMFKIIVLGKLDKWLELMGKVIWEDNGICIVNSFNKVKIIDEE